MNVYNSSLHVLFICVRVYVCVPETKQQQKSETRKFFLLFETTNVIVRLGITDILK